MGNKPIFFYACALVALLLWGCGKKDEPAAQQGTSQQDAAATNSQGGRCGSRVVTDYNNVHLQCDYMGRRIEKARECRQAAEAFLASYPQAACEAQERDDRTGEVRPRRIEAREIHGILDRLTRIGLAPQLN